MIRWLSILWVALVVAGATPAVLILAGATPALAQDQLAQAKQAGMVGEKPDGLAGVVRSSAPSEVRALVERINTQRLERYRRIARENGTSVDKVMAVAGARLIERTPSGQFIMTPSGSWTRK